MGLRFTRRVRLFPGVSVNLSKSGASMSFGVRGAHYTVGSRGRRVTVGIPGTGMYYTQTAANRRAPQARSAGRAPWSEAAAQPAAVTPTVQRLDRLHPGFFKRLVTSSEERELIDGLRALSLGQEDEAFTHLSKAVHLADGAMLAGALALKRGLLPQAEENVRSAIAHADRLGAGLTKYGVTSTLSIDITAELTAHLPQAREGALLLLVEILQKGGRRDEALRALNEIRSAWPDDPVVLASLCELLLDGGTDAERQQVVALTDGLQNLTAVHTVLLLFRVRALRQRKLPDAAIQAATTALARRADRSDELLRELRYERALAYGEAGNAKRARTELERIYADDSAFADVGDRLGMASTEFTTAG